MFKLIGIKTEKGQVFILTLIVMAIGLIVISPLLSYLDSSSRQYISALTKTTAYYAADAMMENILNDVYRGVNIYDYNVSTQYSQDDFLSSGFGVSVVVNNSMPQPLPTPEGGSGWLYLDPGVSICDDSSCDTSLLLSSLAYGATHNYSIYLISETDVQVNWAMDDSGVCCWLGCWAGQCSYHLGGSIWMLYPNGSTIPGTTFSGSSTSTALNIRLNYSVPDEGTGNYTIQFKNTGCYRQSNADFFCGCSGNQTRPSYSASFAGTDDTSYTWVRVGKEEGGVVYSYQDYTITATAKNDKGQEIVSIIAYVRHSPGPLAWWKEQIVEIPSWQVIYH